MKKRKVILVTDGDQHVQRALESLAKQLGGRCISQSHEQLQESFGFV